MDLVRRAQQAAPLLGAQVHQRVSAQTHYAGPQLQAAALSVAEALQLCNEALLVHQEARLAHTVAQWGDLKGLAASGDQLDQERGEGGQLKKAHLLGEII